MLPRGGCRTEPRFQPWVVKRDALLTVGKPSRLAPEASQREEGKAGRFTYLLEVFTGGK
jgi:hypothetical protein